MVSNTPKGDDANLRADLDDGYCRVSLLLAEALSIMPLTPTEHSVVWAVMRYTYGWAKDKDRKSGRFARLSAKVLADTIGVSKRTVDTALGSLVKAHVLLRVDIEPGNVFAYGINPDVSDWGDGKAMWREAQVQFRHVQQVGSYTRNRVRLYAETRIGIREIPYSYTQTCVGAKAGSPRAPGPEGMSYRDVMTENDVTPSAETGFAGPGAPTEQPSGDGTDPFAPNPLPDDPAEPPTDATTSPTTEPTADDGTDAEPPTTLTDNNGDTTQPEPKRPTRRKATPDADWQAKIDALREDQPPAVLEALDAFLDLCCRHNKSGAIAKSREYGETADLLGFCEKEHVTPEAFAFGVHKAIAANPDGDPPGVPNANYVKKAARNYAPAAGDVRRPGLVASPRRSRDPTPEELDALREAIPAPQIGGGERLPYTRPNSL